MEDSQESFFNVLERSQDHPCILAWSTDPMLLEFPDEERIHTGDLLVLPESGRFLSHHYILTLNTLVECETAAGTVPDLRPHAALRLRNPRIEQIAQTAAAPQ